MSAVTVTAASAATVTLAAGSLAAARARHRTATRDKPSTRVSLRTASVPGVPAGTGIRSSSGCRKRQGGVRYRAIRATPGTSRRAAQELCGWPMLTCVGVAVPLDSPVIEAEPGAETAFPFRVENTGMVVDSILLDVLGDAREWAAAEPAQLNLLPGTSERARIVFRPPRSSSLPAGEVPFAIRAMSTEDPDGSVIEEGVVRVGVFTELAVELVPKTASGRRMARQKLIVENRGNEQDEVTISAEDPDVALAFRIKPEAATVLPGTATFIKVRSAPRKRFLKGPSKTLPFQVAVLPERAAPVTADGVMLQRQMMPEWLLPALAITAAAAAVLVALWFTVLKPTVQSAATQAVNQQTQQLTASAKKADKAASQASNAAKQANAAAVAAGGGSQAGSNKQGTGSPKGGTRSGSGKSGGAKSGNASATTSPASGFLQANARPAAGSATASFVTYPYPIAKGHTLNVSDIVLENPVGDNGLLQVRAGASILFEFGLANFRSLDYHFVQALQFTPAAPLTLAVQCANPHGKACTAALSFSGMLSK